MFLFLSFRDLTLSSTVYTSVLHYQHWQTLMKGNYSIRAQCHMHKRTEQTETLGGHQYLCFHNIL